MALIDDLLNTILNGGGDPNVDISTKTKMSQDFEEVEVRSREVIYNSSSDSGEHDTIFAKTSVNVNTGETKSEEGAHGPNYQK